MCGGGRPAEKKGRRGEKILMPVMANEPIILNVYDMVSREVKRATKMDVLLLLYLYFI